MSAKKASTSGTDWTKFRPSRAYPGYVEMIVGARTSLTKITPHRCFSWARQLIVAGERAMQISPAGADASLPALKARATQRRRHGARKAVATRRRQ
jgi:hypothetical protein